MCVFTQTTEYKDSECDWSSDVCSSDLTVGPGFKGSTEILGFIVILFPLERRWLATQSSSNF